VAGGAVGYYGARQRRGVCGWVSGKFTAGKVYRCVLPFLITKVTNVREVQWTVPVTSQQPSVGKVTPLDWKPVGPYPAGTSA
jgi:hypothetical protein